MHARTPKGWLFTLGLAALAVLGSLAARSASSWPADDADHQELRHEVRPEADPCFRYGRLECCIRETD